MLERDAHIYAYQVHHMYVHALNLSFFYHHHHVFDRERSSEIMIPGPILVIRKAFSYFACCFTFSLYTQEYLLLIPLFCL
jgi:hypothetical protein